MSINPRPQKLSLNEQGDLVIDWSDQQTRVCTVTELRDNCPCATCREKRKGEHESAVGLLPVLSIEETQPLTIKEMKPVGSYAYGIVFSDGHDSGIYTLEHLFLLGVTQS